MKKPLLIGVALLLIACTPQINAYEQVKYTELDQNRFKPLVLDHPVESVIYDNLEVSLPTKSTIKQPEPKKIIEPKVINARATSNPKKYALQRIGQTQFNCLDPLWTRESNWNYKAYNRSSGAYGIPQALPGSKMASAGDDWRTNPITQVKWGIRYINSRYGSACGAWRFWQRNHWY